LVEGWQHLVVKADAVEHGQIAGGPAIDQRAICCVNSKSVELRSRTALGDASYAVPRRGMNMRGDPKAIDRLDLPEFLSSRMGRIAGVIEAVKPVVSRSVEARRSCHYSWGLPA